MNSSEKHTITALVEDRAGVLNRISSMFRRRGYNISSLAVGKSEAEGLSRMTFVVDGDTKTVEMVVKNLHKLVEVIKVSDISEENAVSRELAVIRAKCDFTSRSEIMQIVDIFRAKIVDVSQDTLIVEVTGNEDKVNSLVDLLDTFGVFEVMRTGTVAMSRGVAFEKDKPGSGPRILESAS